MIGPEELPPESQSAYKRFGYPQLPDQHKLQDFVLCLFKEQGTGVLYEDFGTIVDIGGHTGSEIYQVKLVASNTYCIIPSICIRKAGQA